MDRIFLDANVLFSAAYSPHAHYRKLWQRRNVELVTTAYAVAEAERNMDTVARLKRLSQLVASLRIVAAVQTERRLSIDLPEKDRPILLAAIAAKATHLLTQDLQHFGKHFGKSIDGVLILRPDAYLRASQSESEN